MSSPSFGGRGEPVRIVEGEHTIGRAEISPRRRREPQQSLDLEQGVEIGIGPVDVIGFNADEFVVRSVTSGKAWKLSVENGPDGEERLIGTDHSV